MDTFIHRADTRGEAVHDWLHSFHTFSFASYHNRERMGFGALRVINDDVIQSGRGFGTHPHENMEIITIPIKGALRHKDSMGNTGVIGAGEIQVMSAGTGITHSEFNASEGEEVSLLQIWVLPKRYDVEPRYDQKAFDPSRWVNRFQPVVSPDGIGGSLVINQDAFFSRAHIEPGKTIVYEPYHTENGVYLFVLDGEVEVAGEALASRDAIGLQQAGPIKLHAQCWAEILCMEVPMR